MHRVTATKEFRLAGWCGDDAALGRIEAQVNQLRERVIADEATRLGEPTPDVVSQLNALRNRPMKVAAVERRTGYVHTGTVAELITLDDLDLARIKTVEISFELWAAGETAASVKLGSSAVKVKLKGTPSWVRLADTELRAELERGRQWWHWLRSDVVSLCYLALLFVAAWFLFRPVKWTGDDGNPVSADSALLNVVVASAFTSLLVGALIGVLINWMVPAFEVAVPAQSRGRRVVVGTFAVVIAPIVITVAASYVQR